MKSTAFDKKSVAFDTKSNGNYKQKKVSKNSLGNRYEFNSDSQEINSGRYEIK